MEAKDIAYEAAKAALSKKASRLILMDLGTASDLCDMQLICSAQNNNQARAISEAIEDSLAELGLKPSIVEGQHEGNWVVMNYGPLLVHIFFDYLRDYYALERLWPKATFVPLQIS